jgi:hypothetical protein
VDRASRNTDYKTVDTAQERTGVGGKMIGFGLQKTETDRKMIRMDRKTGKTSRSRVVWNRNPTDTD